MCTSLWGGGERGTLEKAWSRRQDFGFAVGQRTSESDFSRFYKKYGCLNDARVKYDGNNGGRKNEARKGSLFTRETGVRYIPARMLLAVLV